MGKQLRHDELEELLGAYALDALEGEERETVERHLRSCAHCRGELAEHWEVTAALAGDGAEAPDEEVWLRIRSALEDGPAASSVAPVLPLAPIRRPAGLRVGAAVGAIAAAALIAVLGVEVVHQGHRLDRVAAAVHGDALGRGALAALADPRATRVELQSSDNTAAAEVVLLPDGTGYLVPARLAPLPTDLTYQLWALESGAQVSAGVLGDALGVSAFRASGPVTGFAITKEKAGGVVATANTPVAVGYVRSS